MVRIPLPMQQTRDTSLIPGLGKFLGVGNGNPLLYSCLENSMDRGTWWATVHGVAESDMTEHSNSNGGRNPGSVSFLQMRTSEDGLGIEPGLRREGRASGLFLMKVFASLWVLFTSFF